MSVQIFECNIPIQTTKPVGIIYNMDNGDCVIVMADSIEEAMEVTHEQIEDALIEVERDISRIIHSNAARLLTISI